MDTIVGRANSAGGCAIGLHGACSIPTPRCAKTICQKSLVFCCVEMAGRGRGGVALPGMGAPPAGAAGGGEQRALVPFWIFFLLACLFGCRAGREGRACGGGEEWSSEKRWDELQQPRRPVARREATFFHPLDNGGRVSDRSEPARCQMRMRRVCRVFADGRTGGGRGTGIALNPAAPAGVAAPPPAGVAQARQGALPPPPAAAGRGGGIAAPVKAAATAPPVKAAASAAPAPGPAAGGGGARRKRRRTMTLFC
jgi:hypothetical protein